jgi:hypothetical protein
MQALNFQLPVYKIPVFNYFPELKGLFHHATFSNQSVSNRIVSNYSVSKLFLERSETFMKFNRTARKGG